MKVEDLTITYRHSCFSKFYCKINGKHVRGQYHDIRSETDKIDYFVDFDGYDWPLSIANYKDFCDLVHDAHTFHNREVPEHPKLS